MLPLCPSSVWSRWDTYLLTGMHPPAAPRPELDAIYTFTFSDCPSNVSEEPVIYHWCCVQTANPSTRHCLCRKARFYASGWSYNLSTGTTHICCNNHVKCGFGWFLHVFQKKKLCVYQSSTYQTTSLLYQRYLLHFRTPHWLASYVSNTHHYHLLIQLWIILYQF